MLLYGRHDTSHPRGPAPHRDHTPAASIALSVALLYYPVTLHHDFLEGNRVPNRVPDSAEVTQLGPTQRLVFGSKEPNASSTDRLLIRDTTATCVECHARHRGLCR
jgi:hypothetical protein